MKTDEIIKALECCKDRRCDICDRRYGFHAEESICRLELIEHALHLIGCQKKEIEKQAVNVEALEAGIRREKERADRQSRWIPVTERLPEEWGAWGVAVRSIRDDILMLCVWVCGDAERSKGMGILPEMWEGYGDKGVNMKINEVQPTIRQFEYMQEKVDVDYGSCLWAIFNIDTKNYTLSIESDCGNYSYGWVPTPNSESFVHLMSRVDEEYLLKKLADRTEFDYEASKSQTIDNITSMYEDEPETLNNILEEVEYEEAVSDMKYSAHDFYHEMDKILTDYGCMDRFETIICEMDYTANAKKIANVFCTVLQPFLKEECKKMEEHREED